jgi:hypothetical protein
MPMEVRRDLSIEFRNPNELLFELNADPGGRFPIVAGCCQIVVPAPDAPYHHNISAQMLPLLRNALRRDHSFRIPACRRETEEIGAAVLLNNNRARSPRSSASRLCSSASTPNSARRRCSSSTRIC